MHFETSFLENFVIKLANRWTSSLLLIPPVGPNKTLRHLSNDRGSIRGWKYNLRRKTLLIHSSYKNIKCLQPLNSKQFQKNWKLKNIKNVQDIYLNLEEKLKKLSAMEIILLFSNFQIKLENLR